MATNKTTEQVIKEYMPGWRLVTQKPQADSREDNPTADAQSVNLAALHKKYLGKDSVVGEITGAPDIDAQIVVVEPDNADAYHRGSGRKAVVVVDDKVVGMQG